MSIAAYRLLSLPALLFFSTVSCASDDDIATGGRLYDKWWAEYDLKSPEQTHPAYPADGKQKGANTWRCKECHGWDYQGRDGAYAKGSHFTGIGGIRRWDDGDPEQVVAILKDSRHQYDTVMRDPALRLLALFVTQGQIDTSPLVDQTRKRAKGDASRGKPLYVKNCANCHGQDGRNLNFKTADNPEYLGTIAQQNPWELLHKINNGQPGKVGTTGQGMMHGGMMGNGGMPVFRGRLSLQQQVDIATYAHSLPAK